MLEGVQLASKMLTFLKRPSLLESPNDNPIVFFTLSGRTLALPPPSSFHVRCPGTPASGDTRTSRSR